MWIEDSSNYTDGMEKGFPTSLGLSVIFILYSLWISFEVGSLAWCNLCLRKSLKFLHPSLERQSMEGSLCTYPIPIFFPSIMVMQDTWTRWVIDAVCIVFPPHTPSTHMLACIVPLGRTIYSIWSGLLSDESTVTLWWGIFHADLNMFLYWKFEEGQKILSSFKII